MPLPDPTADAALFNAVAEAITAPGPLPRIELLEDYYTYINGVHLRTIVLHIVGRESTAQFVLPTSDLGLRQLPVQQFVRWAQAFERGEFGVPDALSAEQRRLLVDFARIWEFFARTPFVHRDWEVFARLLRAQANHPWTGDGAADEGYTQLSVLSDWARNTYPAWFGGHPAPGAGANLVADQEGEGLSGGESDSEGSLPSLIDELALSDASLD